MAVSDPTMGVPTPRGVLQGVAAFSWDGSAWQPSGRAGPGVGTPTGVLRGVAPFNWNGAAWQPSGWAGPGVATPTGVLDGVAVYTWSGSAWTPAGGQPTPSTPSGALRGVAAFNWDGSAWQPAGQAGPGVATPYGVLDGVAMFNWTGAAWAAVQGPTLDIVFSGPTLDPRLTFGRGSTATYFDSSGVMRTVSGDTPRFDYDPVTHALNGLLIEESRTNSLLNTATLNTQSVAVTAQAYTLSFYGTGTVTKSGTASGALVGAGAFPQRVSQTFTPTAGTLTLTVTGSALNAQLEAGTFPTSYIPTAGAAVTRALEVCYIPVGTWFSPTALSLMFEVRGVQEAVGAIGGFSDGVFGNSMYAILNGTQLGTAYNLTGGTTVNGAVAVVGANLNKTCCSFTTTRLAVCNNSGAVAVGVLTTTPMPATVRLSLGNDPWSISTAISGYMRRVRYWPRALSDTELQSVTT